MLQSIAPYATEHCSLHYRALLLTLWSTALYNIQHKNDKSPPLFLVKNL